jgi:hypothetical protein
MGNFVADALLLWLLLLLLFGRIIRQRTVLRGNRVSTISWTADEKNNRIRLTRDRNTWRERGSRGLKKNVKMKITDVTQIVYERIVNHILIRCFMLYNRTYNYIEQLNLNWYRRIICIFSYRRSATRPCIGPPCAHAWIKHDCVWCFKRWCQFSYRCWCIPQAVLGLI